MEYSSDFKAYIHQKIHEVSDFFTPEATNKVERKNVKKVLESYRRSEDPAYDTYKDMTQCISLTITDGPLKISSFGFGYSEIEALDAATTALGKQMSEMQDDQLLDIERTRHIQSLFETKH